MDGRNDNVVEEEIQKYINNMHMRLKVPGKKMGRLNLKRPFVIQSFDHITKRSLQAPGFSFSVS